MNPRISRHDGVVLAPYTVRRDIFYGGFTGPDFPFGRIRRDGDPIDVPQAVDEADVTEFLPGRSLYAGFLYDHFGHVTTESIHRLWAFDPSLHDHVVFVAMCFDRRPEMLTSVRIPGYLRDILGLFGVPVERCTIVRRPTRIAELDIPEPGSRLKVGAADWYRDILREVSKPILAAEESAPTPRRLFLGRHHILWKGTLLGERYFADVLAEFGFESLRPETRSIADQCRAMARAEMVVFVEGSAIYSTELLAEMPGRFAMIPRRNVSSFYTPHLGQRCRFAVAGNVRAIHRCKDRNGSSIPSSPVVTHAPQSIHDDLARALDLPLPPFDAARFAEYVTRDIAAVAKDDAAFRERLTEQAFPERAVTPG